MNKEKRAAAVERPPPLSDAFSLLRCSLSSLSLSITASRDSAALGLGRRLTGEDVLVDDHGCCVFDWKEEEEKGGERREKMRVVEAFVKLTQFFSRFFFPTNARRLSLAFLRSFFLQA